MCSPVDTPLSKHYHFQSLSFKNNINNIENNINIET